MKKTLFAFALSIALCAGLSACAGTKQEQTGSAAASQAEGQKGELSLVEAGTLTMITNAEFPPYEYYEGTDIVGIDAEIAKAIADKMGLKLVIQDSAFDSLIPAVASGKADIALAGMTVTEERKQNVEFSETYAQASQAIIVKNDSAITGPDDLNGKKIGVQLGTTGDIYCEDIEGATIERFPKGLDAALALSQGKVDAVVIDKEPSKVYVTEVEGIKMLEKEFTTEDYAIAIKKGNTALLEQVNAAIQELKADGTLDSIIAKYIKSE